MTSQKRRKEYSCGQCGKSHLTWEGKCRFCGAVASITEITRSSPRPVATQTQKSLMRRSKNSERNIARRMTAIDGPDLNYQKIASSTGRIGMITNIRVDAISAQYVTENKNRLLPKWLLDAWILIQQRSIDFNKYCLLHLDPPNLKKEFVLNGTKVKTSTMAIITQDRHEQLIKTEHTLAEVLEILSSDAPVLAQYRTVREKLGVA